LFCCFGCDGENVFDEKILKAGMLDASSFSTNFNTYYDFSIVDAVAQQLLYEIAKAPGCKRWGVVAELYSVPGACSSHMLTRHADELTLNHSWLHCQLNSKVNLRTA
jgi:hypothetical protein